MNSRMNFGRGSSIPQENNVQIRSSWIPLTPEKPMLQRSNPIPENQFGGENWQELVGIYGGLLQETTNYNGVIQNFNPNEKVGQNGGSYNWDNSPTEKGSVNHHVGSHKQNFNNDSAAWNKDPLAELLAIKNVKNAASVASANGIPSKGVHVSNGAAIPSSYSQVGSNWTDSDACCSLLGSQNCAAGSNRLINDGSLQQMPYNGFPIPYRPNYNLNSPPRSEADASSSITNSFQFAPVTPDQAKQFKNHCHSEVQNFSVDDSSSQEKDKQENLFVSIGSEATENHCDELLQNIVDSLSAAIATPLKEKNNSDQGGNQGIDLNKTPQQKAPKRRKHRPKVIVEGKPKRTLKSTTPNNTNSKDKPSGKRKYVRRNGLKASPTQQLDAINEVTVPTAGSVAKSCRRVLNFDLEKEAKDQCQDEAASHQAEQHQEKRTAINLNLDSQTPELCTRISSDLRTKSAAQLWHQNGYIAGKLHEGTTYNLQRSMDQMPGECIPLPEICDPEARTAAMEGHTLNAIARSVSLRNTTPRQNSGKNGYSQVHQHVHGEALGQIVLQANANCENFDRIRELIWQSTPHLVAQRMANSDPKTGSKRDYGHTAEQTPFFCKDIYQLDDYKSNGMNFSTGCPETQKKKKTDNSFHAIMSGSPCITAVKESSRQVATEYGNVDWAHSLTSQVNTRILESYFETEKASQKLNNGVNDNAVARYVHSMAAQHNFQKQLISSELHSQTERMPEKRPRVPTKVHDFTSLTAMTSWNQRSLVPAEKASRSDNVQGTEAFHANMSAKTQAVEQTTSNLEISSIDKVLLQEKKDTFHGNQQFSMKVRGLPEKQKYSVPLDEIIHRLEGLNIGRRNEIVRQEQNALVPYKGDGTIVAYEFTPIKKRKPRPKVNLDPETNRIWKLLMGKEGSEGAETADKEKEKWWEEERKVFRGRADSFIARMHLVQGDRRFSQWKGSVVDSVIGVFLTQNVSDHLSSSAFMSLAAKFPLQSTTANQACFQTGTNILVEEQEVRILDPDINANCHAKIPRQPVYNQISITSRELSNRRTENLASGTRSSLASEQNWRTEEIVSAQNSFGSFSLQANAEIRSYSGSNIEVEDTTTVCKSNNIHGYNPIDLLQTEKTAAFQKFYGHVIGSSLLNEGFNHGHKQSQDREYGNQIQRLNRVDYQRGVSSTFTYPINSNTPHVQGSIGPPSNFRLHTMPDSGVLGVDRFGVLQEESISSSPSAASGIDKSNGVVHMSKSIGHMAESTRKTAVQQNGGPRIQATLVGPSAFLSKKPTHHESSLQPVPHTEKDQLSSNAHDKRSRTFQSESRLVKEPKKPAEALTMQTGMRQQAPNDPKFTGKTFGMGDIISIVENPKCSVNEAVEANAKDQVYPSGEAFSLADTKISNIKKGRADDEKGTSFDWDSLRKQVHPNGRRKERSKDTMDSLDYEAVRCADVNEISSAIKERGMNNMLADRIKDFLNRLVREHRNIDLEWLRDVPPDKVKDYLLSIRGLGLKSVECVRLLTLHHLAFPVDTNVGRIAVRLGWVPLQPLPESLQLHLLELYPVLESIQKYIWPRLCKLDQRTLYELHYQMITFGKVFCTKNKPNCNACPMRGECRHFASAFASARLALPGPEEKSMVSSGVTIPADRNPTVTINPMLLPPAENNAPRNTGFVTGKYEPIVEEPATPEPESTEVTESDIEDAFYEDPDEIPTIKLNIEEFTLNLHNYIQENSMELQEGDMSKALVALNPEAASIPTTKLKNVSRLRTEHQVYELPDTHHLLKGLDRREPDDPSPYLLAIWTPGEEPNSVEPPERCGSQDSGKLCNERTCFSCSSIREANSQTVRGTLLIPCRTAMRGSFPLNGTYFQVNEVFADHESSLNPIDVPRAWIWNLPRRTVYFGTSVSTIFKGLSTESIQYCFWRGFVCVRGFDQKTRAPRPLMARLHFPASKLVKTKKEDR